MRAGGWRLRHHPSTATKSGLQGGRQQARHGITTDLSLHVRDRHTPLLQPLGDRLGRGGLLLYLHRGWVGNLLGGGKHGKRRWDAKVGKDRRGDLLERRGGDQASVHVGLGLVHHHVDDQAWIVGGSDAREAGDS